MRDFHAVIGEETKKQCLESFGSFPDILLACVGGGSNAMGLFHPFVKETSVRLIGVEASTPIRRTEVSLTKGWKRPIAFDPPPTQASKISGKDPNDSKHCFLVSSPITA